MGASSSSRWSPPPPPVNRNCQAGQWSNWDQCTKECGTGFQYRRRPIAVNASGNGQLCYNPNNFFYENYNSPLHLSEWRYCNRQPCPPPSNCEVSGWTYGPCSKECGGGTQLKTRTIVKNSVGTGVPCKDQEPGKGGTYIHLKETVPCNTATCSVDCKVSNWTDGNCSKPCGGGKLIRRRTKVENHQGNGKPCVDGFPQEGKINLQEEMECNTEQCPTDCVMSAWENDGSCSKPCGTGKQKMRRTITTQQYPQGGTGYIFKYMKNTPLGNISVSLPIQKIMENQFGVKYFLTNDISNLNNTYAINENNQVFVINKPIANIKIDNEFLLSSQLPNQIGIGELIKNGPLACGDTEKEVSCNTNPCPVDCVLSDWSAYGECSQPCGGGTKTRTKSVITEPAHGGKECSGPTTESVECNTQPCPVNCVTSDWTSYSPCNKDCGPGKKVKTRTITQQALHGGTSCPSNLTQEEDCQIKPCPIDCEMKNWSSYSECSKTCGSGKTTRRRTVKTRPQYGGRICAAEEETYECNTNPCPIDCVLSDWGPWETCTNSCGPGTKTRRKTVTQPAMYGGQACGTQVETVDCGNAPCPIDCKMSDWGNYGSCSTQCGPGMKIRRKTVLQQSAYGGKACTAQEEATDCGNQPCPVDCKLSEWSEWETCTTNCGPGTKTRTKTITQPPLHGGQACGPQVETADCGNAPCPVDCKLSDWSSWQNCTTTCGPGTKTRTKTITQQPMYGGSACGPQSETVDCGNEPCPINCAVSNWSDFGPCNKECGGGKKKRNRTINTQPKYNGTACPPLEEESSCNTNPCPVDCVVSNWSNYSNCNKPCGGGVKFRNRSVTTQPQYGGKECPVQEEILECNTEKCRTDCIVSPWGAYSSCSEPCGPGKKTRKRNIIKPQYPEGAVYEIVGRAYNPGQTGTWGTVPVEFQGYTGKQFLPVPIPVERIFTTKDNIQYFMGQMLDANGRRMAGLTVARTFDLNKNPLEEAIKSSGNLSTFPKTSEPGLPDYINQNWKGESIIFANDVDKVDITKDKKSVWANFNPYSLLKVRPNKCPVLEETAECMVKACPKDCVVTDWSPYSACSKTCGTGYKTRSRQIVSYAEDGGALCPILGERKECNTEPCSTDCAVSDWSQFSQCSSSCDGGTKSRTRTIIRQPSTFQTA